MHTRAHIHGCAHTHKHTHDLSDTNMGPLTKSARGLVFTGRKARPPAFRVLGSDRGAERSVGCPETAGLLVQARQGQGGRVTVADLVPCSTHLQSPRDLGPTECEKAQPSQTRSPLVCPRDSCSLFHVTSRAHNSQLCGNVTHVHTENLLCHCFLESVNRVQFRVRSSTVVPSPMHLPNSHGTKSCGKLGAREN